MSTALTLECTKREKKGTGAARRLRRQSQVPGIIYGPKQAPINITIELKDLKKQLENQAFYSQIIQLNLDEQPIKVVLKGLQRHPAKETPLHADFLAIDLNKTIRKRVPIHFINEDKCVGVKLKGGVISKQLTEMEVVCLPEHLPTYLELDMSDIDVGTTVHLSDIQLPEGVSSFDLSHGADHDLSVVFVKPPKGGDSAEAAEGEAADKPADAE